MSTLPRRKPVLVPIPRERDEHPYLRRFRADPSRIRVGIMRYGEGPQRWVAMVTQKQTGAKTLGFSDDPERAVEIALGHARANRFDGIDLDMQWSYPHPQIRKPLWMCQACFWMDCSSHFERSAGDPCPHCKHPIMVP